ncbi:uncharacterized protein LOC144472385 [Augochlora pura]
MDILPSGNIFRELQDIHDTGYFSAQPSLEDHWQQENTPTFSLYETPKLTASPADDQFPPSPRAYGYTNEKRKYILYKIMRSPRVREFNASTHHFISISLSLSFNPLHSRPFEAQI